MRMGPLPACSRPTFKDVPVASAVRAYHAALGHWEPDSTPTKRAPRMKCGWVAAPSLLGSICARTSRSARSAGGLRPGGQAREKLKSQASIPTGTANPVRLALRRQTHDELDADALGRGADLTGRQMRAHFNNMREAAGGLRPDGPPRGISKVKLGGAKQRARSGRISAVPLGGMQR
jgi:hypothetical protein